MTSNFSLPAGSETKLILPPPRPYTRAGAWSLFERRFEPIMRDDDSLIWEAWDVPRGADARHWWTILGPMTGSLYLAAGFHFVNRLGYVHCRHRWGGEWSDHPEYRYD